MSTTRLAAAALLAAAAAATAVAQTSLDWRRIGNANIAGGYASMSGGPVDRVWYSADGARLYVKARGGRVFETADFETWSESTAVAPQAASGYRRQVPLPEAAAQVRPGSGAADAASARLYAMGRAVYRSTDEGRSWQNVSHYKGRPILGEGFTDLAVSPRDPDEITVSNAAGAWRSLDGGLSWAGLNEDLPNLPARRLLRTPGPRGQARILMAGGGEAVWPAGGGGWIPAQAEWATAEAELRRTVSGLVGGTVTAVSAGGDFLYAGGGGRVWSSADQGRVWRAQTMEATTGAAERIFVAPEEPRVALAAFAAPAPATEGAATRGAVLRTFNGGLFWDDLTGNLPAGSVHAVTADLASGAIYAATDSGVWFTYADLRSAGPAAPWQRVPGTLAAGAAAWDVRLDEGGHQLYVVMDGRGVFAALAPHRLRDPRVVNAADLSARAAAPGTLLSVLGAAVSSARSGALDVPVLAASQNESQIQVPFDVTGSRLPLALETAAAPAAAAAQAAQAQVRREFNLALAETSPAIFIDRDGAPMLLDAGRGVLLDPATPARAGGRIQIIATGLGKVTPDWPAGTPAPAGNPPRVAAPVRVFVDRVPVEVTRATLAPGFVGFYLVEIVLPEAVNDGPAELYIEAAGRASGRVTIQLAQ